jgi:APA family basic amino acid/polyamine antiporter
MIALLAAIFPLDLLANLTSMGTLIAFSAVCAGVLILRHTMPDLPRTFRVPWVWFTCLAGVGSCLALLLSLDWFNWAILGIWTLIGFCIYFMYGRRHSLLHRAIATAQDS